MFGVMSHTVLTRLDWTGLERASFDVSIVQNIGAADTVLKDISPVRVISRVRVLVGLGFSLGLF